jgi:hypothetical protein
MSLNDVFLYYNRMRGNSIISADDLIKACAHLENMPSSKIMLRKCKDGIKILQLKVLDMNEDFNKNVKPLLDKSVVVGISAE